MKISTIARRTAPVLAAAATVSAIYGNYAFASSNTIPSSEVILGDQVKIGAGYYEDDTNINIPTLKELVERGDVTIEKIIEYGGVTGVDKVVASYYEGGNNDKIGLNADSDARDVTLNTDKNTELGLGASEQIVLPKGYYSYDVTISNGVKNRGMASATLLPGNSVSIDEGYYAGGTITASANTETFTFPEGSDGTKVVHPARRLCRQGRQ